MLMNGVVIHYVQRGQGDAVADAVAAPQKTGRGMLTRAFFASI
jgi:hypothetical protein